MLPINKRALRISLSPYANDKQSTLFGNPTPPNVLIKPEGAMNEGSFSRLMRIASTAAYVSRWYAPTASCSMIFISSRRETGATTSASGPYLSTSISSSRELLYGTFNS